MTEVDVASPSLKNSIPPTLPVLEAFTEESCNETMCRLQKNDHIDVGVQGKNMFALLEISE